MSKTTVTTIGALTAALASVVKATGGKSALITVFDGDAYVEARGERGGYAKFVIETTKVGDNGFAVIGAGVINAVLGQDAADLEVGITTSADGLIMRFGGSRIRLRSPENDATKLFTSAQEDLKAVKLFTAKGKDLRKNFIAATAYAAQHDVRSFFTGVHIANLNGNLRITASDGFSCHRLDSDIALEAGVDDIDVIVPIATAEAMCSVFAPETDVCVRLLGKNLIEFTTGKMTWVSNLIAERFPNTESLFAPEKQSKASVMLKKSDILVALNRIRALSDKRISKMQFGNEKLTMRSIDDEQVSTIVCEKINDEAVEFAFTTELLTRAVGAIPGELLLLRKIGEDPTSKIYLRPIDSEGKPVANWYATIAAARS